MMKKLLTSEYGNEKYLMDYKSSNKEIMAAKNIDKIFKKLIDLPVQRYQVALEKSKNGSAFLSPYVDLLQNKYKLQP